MQATTCIGSTACCWRLPTLKSRMAFTSPIMTEAVVLLPSMMMVMVMVMMMMMVMVMVMVRTKVRMMRTRMMLMMMMIDDNFS